jgi:predicted PurR-regulated permease PerM
MREHLPTGVDAPRPIQWIDRAHVGWVLLGLFVAGVFAFVFYSYVGTFVFAVFIYYATRPVYRRVEKYVRPPSLAAGLSLFLLALPALLLLGFTALVAFREVASFASQNQLNVVSTDTRTYILLQPYIDLLESPVQLLTSPDEITAIRDILEDAGVLTALSVIGTGLMHAFIMVGVAFYLLRDDQQFSRWARGRFGDEAGLLEEFMDAVDHDYHQVFFGNILNALITGLIAAVTYNAINFVSPAGLSVPYPTLIGLLSGAASLIPLIGMKLVYVPVTVYLLGASLTAGGVDTLWFPVTFAAVAFFVVDVIPDMVLRPYVSARDLHMGTVMFAYLLGPLLFGWYGIFLGPMLLVIAVRFNRIVLPELLDRVFGSSTDQKTPAPPVPTAGQRPIEDTEGDAPGSDPTAGDD